VDRRAGENRGLTSLRQAAGWRAPALDQHAHEGLVEADLAGVGRGRSAAALISITVASPSAVMVVCAARRCP